MTWPDTCLLDPGGTHYPFGVAKHPKSAVARPRPDTASRRRLRLSAGDGHARRAVAGRRRHRLAGGPAGAKSTTTTTKAGHGTTTTTTAAGHKPSPADQWLLKAIGAEAKIGSVRIDGKIHQNKTVIYLDLLVNARRRGRRHVHPERLQHRARAGRHRSSISTHRRSTGRRPPRPPRPTATGASGSRSRPSTPASSPSTSSSTRTTSCSPPSRATRRPLTMGKPTTYPGPQGRHREGDRRQQRQARRPAPCTSAQRESRSSTRS